MKLFVRIATISALLALTFGGLNFQVPKAKAVEKHITSCQTLNQASTTYLLDNDVSSPGKCFEVAASDLALDLNGHTITYGTSDAKGCNDGKQTCGIQVSYRKSNIIIKNGTIITSPGTDTQNWGIFVSSGEKNIEMTQLNLNVHGPNAAAINIYHDPSSDLIKIHHNNITMKRGDARCTGNISTDGWYHGILGAGNHNLIYENTIIDPNRGMEILGGTGHEIYNNTIHHWRTNKNGAGITLVSTKNAKVFNNFIETQDGNGIYTRTETGDSYGNSENNEIYNNYLDLSHGEASECGEYTMTAGIYFRFGGELNNHIYHNFIKVDNHAAGAAPWNNFLLNTGNDGPNTGNVFENNYGVTLPFDAAHSRGNFYVMTAGAISIAGAGVSGNTFRKNVFMSNFRFVGSYGQGANNNYITSNVFVKGDGATSEFNTMNYNENTRNTYFLDTALPNGVSLEQAGFLNNPNDYWVKWYLDLVVKNSSGSPISGANVSIKDQFGSTQIFKTNSEGRTIDGNGQVTRPVLTRFFNSNGGKTMYTPHEIIISASGYPNITIVNLDANASKEITANLSTGELSPAIFNIAAVPHSFENKTQGILTFPTATITWNTDQAIESSIEYGKTTSYGQTASGGTGTSHKVDLSGLTNGIYHFRVKAGENTGIDHTFDIFTAGLAGGTSGVTLTKSVNKATAISGDELIYTISYTTSQNITNVKIEDPIPVGTSFVSAENGGQLIDNKAVWNIMTILANTPSSVSFKVKIN